MQLLTALLFLLPTIFAQSLVESAPSIACNNSPSLCSKPYNKVTHLGAHDSPFLANAKNGFSISGNQYLNSTTQLDAGVRLLSTQVHVSTDKGTELRLCHSDCDLLDAGSLIEWLSSVKAWMDVNPNEVVTILLVNAVKADASRLDAAFRASGMVQYAYIPTGRGPQGQWPTLGQMIQSNTRLVTFVATLPDNSAAPYLLDQFSYTYENPFEVTSQMEFSCMPERPRFLANNPNQADGSGRLFVMNHFLGQKQLFAIVTPDRIRADTTNSPDESVTGSLGRQLARCNNLYGKPPTFVLVDWFNMGPAMSSIDGFNNVTVPVGRKEVAQTTSGSAQEDPLTQTGAATSIRTGMSSVSCILFLSVILLI